MTSQSLSTSTSETLELNNYEIYKQRCLNWRQKVREEYQLKESGKDSAKLAIINNTDLPHPNDLEHRTLMKLLKPELFTFAVCHTNFWGSKDHPKNFYVKHIMRNKNLILYGNDMNIIILFQRYYPRNTRKQT